MNMHHRGGNEVFKVQSAKIKLLNLKRITQEKVSFRGYVFIIASRPNFTKLFFSNEVGEIKCKTEYWAHWDDSTS